MTLDFWFEFGSTYSYPAAMRVEEEAAASGVTVRWRAFLLGPIFRDQGLTDSPFNVFPIKGRYMWRDMERICEAEQIGFRKPSVFPRNGLLAARVACRFSEEAWLPEFVRAVYIANFEYDQDISSPGVISRCLPKSVDDKDWILNESQSSDSKALLRTQTEVAAQLGIFGAPFFAVKGELFWGNDRLGQALAWAKREYS